MLAYQKTWKNTVIKVFSIIEIVISVLAIIASFMFLVSGTIVGGAAATMSVEDFATANNLTAEEAAATLAVMQNQGPAIIVVVGVLLLVGSIADLVAGIFGVRGANDPSKLTPFIVITIIGLVITGVGTIINAVQGSFSWSNLISIAISAFLLYLAIDVRKGYNDYLSSRKKTRR